MLKKIKNKKNLFRIGLIIISLSYLFIHLIRLSTFPVFADEAIYTRWAQLIIDDPFQYLFFPLNDGKTPLFIWLLTPLQFLFANQLFSARLLSVLVGLLQAFIFLLLIKKLGGGLLSRIISVLLSSFLPFFFVYHHLALMDGMMTLFLSISLLLALNLFQSITKNKKSSPSIIDQFLLLIHDKKNITYILLQGIFSGLAIWTKLPAILFFPIFFLFSFFLTDYKNFFSFVILEFLVIIISLFLFLILRLHPAFGQLFSRGGDFLYSFNELIFDHKYFDTIINIPTHIHYFVKYFTPLVFISPFALLFLKKHRKATIILFLSAFLFFLPIAIMGKVVYPRYYLPISIFFIIIFSLQIENLYLLKNRLAQLFSIIILIIVVYQSLSFDITFIFNYNQTPFVPADQKQYLYSWSSGHGIYEVYQYLREESHDKSIAILTEGYFGTLPDGLLMYFHHQDVDNIYIEGIGQPIFEIPDKYIDKALKYDQQLLLVNSHRLKLDLDDKVLIKRYCRLDNHPCLELYDISSYLQNSQAL